jgi:hypothetical protein
MLVLDLYCYGSDGSWYTLQWWCWISTVLQLWALVDTAIVVLERYCYSSNGCWRTLQFWCWIYIVNVVMGAGTDCNGGVEFLLM